MIAATELTHSYGAHRALRDVTLEVGEGQVFGFVGPNGAGKTTTIRALATLLTPDAGEIEICGVDALSAPQEVRRSIGFVPDFCGVYDRLSVAEYVDFFAEASGIDEREARKKAVGVALELTGMQNMAHRMCSELSRGVLQRLALSRALVHDPSVLLLDEPASGLDPRARLELLELLRQLKELGKTILLSSHILTELASLVTHVGIIERGKMIASGPVQKIADMLGQERVVLIRLLESASGRGVLLHKVDGVESVVEREPRLLAVTVQGEERSISETVRCAVEIGLPVIGVELEWTDLERVFLVATRGDVQ